MPELSGDRSCHINAIGDAHATAARAANYMLHDGALRAMLEALPLARRPPPRAVTRVPAVLAHWLTHVHDMS